MKIVKRTQALAIAAALGLGMSVMMGNPAEAAGSYTVSFFDTNDEYVDQVYGVCPDEGRRTVNVNENIRRNAVKFMIITQCRVKAFDGKDCHGFGALLAPTGGGLHELHPKVRGNLRCLASYWPQ
jgi:hypothetical protein